MNRPAHRGWKRFDEPIPLPRGPRTKSIGFQGHQAPDETRMKQYPVPNENVVKQTAGINDLDQTTGGDS
jgi:hypothetical protein